MGRLAHNTMFPARASTAAFLVLISLLSSAQNLVINPGFETITSCPMGPSELDKATPWRDPFVNLVGDTCSTSDLFNACNALGALGVGVPANILGNEAAHTGSGYAGIIVYESFSLLGCESLFGSGWREYVEGTLTEPLLAGQTYCISFFVSLADNVKFASSSIGVHLSPTLVSVNCATIGAASNLPLTPQLTYSGPPITVTSGWQRLQWNYTAAGGERYIVIGNHNNDAGTNYECVNASAFNPYAYYFIDDVSVVPEPCCNADIAPVPALCANDPPITLTAETPGGTWSGPGITNPATGAFSPLLAGTGTHTIVHSIACGSDTLLISVSDCVTLAVCAEANGTWTVSNGTGPYSWQNQSTTQDCSACLVGCQFPPGCATNVTGWATFATGSNVAAPTTYPVRVTDAAGNEVLINSPATVQPCTACPPILVSIVDQSDVTCPGSNNGTATVVASGGTQPYTYSWSPGALTGTTQSTLAVGVYTVTATDAANCTGSVTVAIGQPLSSVSISIISTTDANCNGNTGTASAQAIGGTAPYSYAWSPAGGSGPVATDLGPGTYILTVTDANGCTAQATTVIGVLGGPVIVSTTPTPSECGTATGTITVVATGSDLQYSIDGGSTLQSAPLFTGLAAGTYTITVSDGSGCTTTEQVAITTLDGPVIVSTSVVAPSCSSSDGSITVQATGQGLSYSIDGGSNFQPSNVFDGLPSGTWNIIVSDGACTATTTVTLNDADGPQISAVTVSGPLCAGDSNGGATVLVQGTGSYQFSLDGTSFSSSASFSGLPAGEYIVVVRDAGGCTSSESFSLVDPLPLLLNVNSTAPACAGECNGVANALATGGTLGTGYTYSWSGTVALPSAASVTGLCAGAYNVQVTDANGCSAGAPFVLQAPTPLVLESITPLDESCRERCDGAVLVVVPGAVGYQLGQGPVQPTGQFTGLCPGPITITAVDGNGCTLSTSTSIAPGELVLAGFTRTPLTATTQDPTFTFTNTSVNANTSAWNFGVGGTSFLNEPTVTLPSEPGDYEVCLTVTGPTGCEDSTCAILIVRPDFVIHVPNSFTPDEDGINDLFMAVGDPALNASFTLSVFDRWGEEIFSSNDITVGWNGTYLGIPVQQEVYIWQVEVRDPYSAEIRKLRGHVTLLR